MPIVGTNNNVFTLPSATVNLDGDMQEWLYITYLTVRNNIEDGLVKKDILKNIHLILSNCGWTME